MRKLNIITLNSLGVRSKIWDYNLSFVLRWFEVSEVWLFNCNEATQHNLLQHKIKLSLISKIFITDLSLYNIAGLHGLLSTLNLESRNKTLYLYGPQGLNYYLKFSSKYSQTNFCYSIKVFDVTLPKVFISTSYIIKIIPFQNDKRHLGYIIFSKQKPGRFKLLKAQIFNLTQGPLYGKLKQYSIFLTPDGNIIHGKNFADIPEKGEKLILIPYVCYNKTFTELCWKASNIICLTK